MALDLPDFLGPLRPLPRQPVLKGLLALFESDPRHDEFPFQLLGQQATNWCWSAVTQAAAFHFGQPFAKQTSIATTHIQRSRPNLTCLPDQGEVTGGRCGNPCSKPCNGAHDVAIVLAENRMSVRTLSVEAPVRFERIQEAIGERALVVCRIDFGGGLGHFVCVSGWRSGPGGPQVIVHDPRGAPALVKVPAVPMLHSDLVGHYAIPGYVGVSNYAYAVRPR